MRFLSGCLSCGFALSIQALVAFTVQAQPLRRLSEASCPQCRVKVERLRTVGELASEPLEDWPFSVAMDSRGRIAVGIKGGKGMPRVTTDPSGPLVPLGREGAGPGEFIRPTTVAFGPGDTLHVFDLGSGRRTEFAPNGRVVRSSPYVGGSALVRVMGDGAALSVFAERRHRFHVLSRDAGTVRSFGAPTVAAQGRRQPSSLVSNVDAGRFWSVVGSTYQLEQWSVSGTTARVDATGGLLQVPAER